MTDKVIENNKVTIIGEITRSFRTYQDKQGNELYRASIRTERLSGTADTIQLLVPENIGIQAVAKGPAQVEGMFYSHNYQEDGKNKTLLYVFATKIEFMAVGEVAHANLIYLDGYICKEPVYRITPLGREITDMLLAVNRPDGQSDYIQCICWGRKARNARELSVGDRCAVWGRIQSRTYMKQISEDQVSERTAYEVSVNRLAVLPDERNR